MTTLIPTTTGNLLEILSPQDLQQTTCKTIALNLLPLWDRPSTEIIKAIPSLAHWINTAQSIIPINGLQWFYQNDIKVRVKDNYLTYRSPFDGREIKITAQEFMALQSQWKLDYAVTLSCPFYALKNTNPVKLFKEWIDHALSLAQKSQQKLIIELPCLPAAQLDEIITGYAANPRVNGVIFFWEDKDDTFLIDQQIFEAVIARIPAQWHIGINTNINFEQLNKIKQDRIHWLITETPYNDAKQGHFYYQGKTLSLADTRFVDDTQPLDLACACHTCANYTKAYLHHLLNAKEVFLWRLIAVHNFNAFNRL